MSAQNLTSPVSALDAWFAGRLAAIDATVQENAHSLAMVAGAQPAAGKPVFVFTSGVPGSGKSTVARQIAESRSQFDTPPAHLTFDAVMEAYDGYRADYEEQGRAAAFANWELVARATGYATLQKLIGKGANIVFDHTFSDPTHSELLKALQAETDYRLVYVPVSCPVAVCVERAAARSRHLPENYIAERAQIIAGLHPVYMTLADTVIAVDSSGALPATIDISKRP